MTLDLSVPHSTTNLIFRHYSLEVVQHPLRARMCGFGDKASYRPSTLIQYLTGVQDRRPLAPAAVAKMLVRRQDDTVVDAE